MEDVGKFRRFFNNEMHKELMTFEYQRKKLLFFMSVLVLLLLIISVAVGQLAIFVLKLFLPIPWVLLFFLFKNQVNQFKGGFKPLVVQLMLQYMQSDLSYQHQSFVSQDSFERAGIFPVHPEVYIGEDYIMGRVGTLFFELSELKILKRSSINFKMVQWFDGLFFHLNFDHKATGRMVIIPRKERQHFIATFKGLTKYGAYEVDETGFSEFDRLFLVYTDATYPYREMLTKERTDLLLHYYPLARQKVYASFVNNHFYVAINEPRNLLEASIFQSNAKFERILAYYRELNTLTQLVHDFNQTA